MSSDVKASGALRTAQLLLPSTYSATLVAGIYVFFLLFGFAQESVYRVSDGDTHFTFPVFLVALLCTVNWLLSSALVRCSEVKEPAVSPWALRQIALSSVTYVASMVCTNLALKHVNYPIQVLVKSAKCVPVILGGLLFFGRRYPLHDYAAVGVVTSALVVFNSQKSGGGQQTALGVILLCISLLADSMTGPRQDALLARERIGPLKLMQLTNAFGAALAGGAFLLLEGTAPLYFCARVPAALWHVGLFCLSAGIGQLFIFGSLAEFGSLQLTLITTTRKFFTVLCSVLIFNHRVSPLQWTCVVAIFTALALQSICSKRSKMRHHKSQPATAAAASKTA